MGIYDNWTYTDLHQLNLDWVIKIVKEYQTKYDKLEIDFAELQAFVNDYFDSTDFAQLVSDKIDELVANGTFTTLFAQYTTRIYDTVASMKADTTLTPGAHAHTMGYYNPGDGGDADYIITNVTPGTWYEVTTTGLNAELITNRCANIMQYGAVADNATDNATRIQAALDNNDAVTIPDEIFSTGTINIPAGVTLINNGTLNSLSIPLITMNSNSKLSGGNYATSLSGNSAVVAADASDIIIEHCNISGFANKGISISNCSNVLIDNCTVNGATGATGGGISLSGNSVDCNVTNCLISASRIGLIFQSVSGCNASNIICRNCTAMGICFDGTVSNSGDGAYKINVNNIVVSGQTNTSYGAIYAGNGSHDLVVSDFNIHDCALGIKATANSSNLIDNWRISNGIITNSGTYGIQLSYGQNTHIDNVIVDTAPTGVTFYGADYGLLSNSTIRNCTTRGVMIQAGNCMVIANKILNNGTGIQYAYGATSPVHNSMFNNLFEGNTTDATLAGSPIVANNVNYTA